MDMNMYLIIWTGPFRKGNDDIIRDYIQQIQGPCQSFPFRYPVTASFARYGALNI